MVATLYLTRDCNQSCSYCYAGRRRPERMEPITAEMAVDIAADHSDLMVGVRFFGGEPLLEWELVRHITAYTLSVARDRRLLPSFSISTNGTLLEEEHLSFFEEFDIGVGISIDGSPEVHDRNRPMLDGSGSFSRVREKYLLARKRDIRLAVELVLDTSNLSRLADSVRYLADEMGVQFIVISVNVFADWQPHHLPVLEDQYREISEFYAECFGVGRPLEIDAINNKINVLLRGGYDLARVCQLGQTEITVVPDGRIYPCLRIVGWDEEGKTTLGTVESGLDEDIASNMYIQSKVKPEECVACAYDRYCTNWCASSNLVMTGSLGKVGKFLCAYEHILIEICRDLQNNLDMTRYREFYQDYLCGCRSQSVGSSGQG